MFAVELVDLGLTSRRPTTSSIDATPRNRCCRSRVSSATKPIPISFDEAIVFFRVRHELGQARYAKHEGRWTLLDSTVTWTE